MPLTTLHEAPALDSFTPLVEHQSQTPSTFFDAKPILHYHASSVRALAPRSQAANLPIFTSAGSVTNTGEEREEQTVGVVDAFVSSESLTLYNPLTSIGIAIPYPSISLHAIQRLLDPSAPSTEIQGLYMQLELSDPNEANEEEDTGAIELTLIPPPPVTEGATSSIQTLFEAVSNCSNLHPDPTFQDDEEMDEDGSDSRIMFEGNVGYEGISGLPGVQQGALDGGLPPPFPGSGGWITAENVSQYFDEEGNWIGGEGEALGEGAGRIRTRDEVEDAEQVNGHGEHAGDDSKRPRTD